MLHRFSVISSLALACLLSGDIAQAQTFDATADFVPNVPNPNGVWKYGYTNTLGSSLIPFSAYYANENIFGWRTNLGSGAPIFFKATAVGGQFGVAQGQTALHGGPQGQFAVLRFTAPSTNVYAVSCAYFTGDGGNTDAYLLLNSNAGTPLFSTPSTTGGGTFAKNSLQLNAGDTLDYVIGNGGDGFGSDSTPVTFRITAGVPAPCSLLTALIGVVPGVMLLRRRRKSVR